MKIEFNEEEIKGYTATKIRGAVNILHDVRSACKEISELMGHYSYLSSSGTASIQIEGRDFTNPIDFAKAIMPRIESRVKELSKLQSKAAELTSDYATK